MKISRSNIVFSILLLTVVTLAAAIEVDHSRPNYEFLPDMKYSSAWDAFSANPNFANGRTLQAPVPGTIPRGDLPLYFMATKEDALRAGEELQNPFAINVNNNSNNSNNNIEATAKPDGIQQQQKPIADTPEAIALTESAKKKLKLEAEAQQRLRNSVERGGQVFQVFCISCHGPTGAGDGPVAKHGFPPPPPLTTGKSAKMKDGQLFHILTYGQGNMLSMSAQLSRDRRWDVINHIRSLQKNAVKSGQKAPTTTKNSPATVPSKSVGPSKPEERKQ